MRASLLSGFLAAAAALVLSACEKSPTQAQGNATLVVEPYLVPCTGMMYRSCMAVSDGKAAPNYFYEGIDGFQFQWGYRQTLAVQKDSIPDPVADGPSFRYVLVSTTAKVAAPVWEFEAYLHDTTALSFDGDTLSIEGYPSKIVIADSADRGRIGRVLVDRGVSIKVKPLAGDVLQGQVWTVED